MPHPPRRKLTHGPPSPGKCRLRHRKDAWRVNELLQNIEDARALAQAIVDTVREPLLVLDSDLPWSRPAGPSTRPSRSAAKTSRAAALRAGRGAWDIPALRRLLEKIVPDHAVMDGFEVEQDFPRHRPPHLPAACPQGVLRTTRPCPSCWASRTSPSAAPSNTKRTLLKRTETCCSRRRCCCEEMQHRIVNSLQIIASILMLKARAVTSEETRQHLQDAHRRVMSVAAVQQHLHGSGGGDVDRDRPLSHQAVRIARRLHDRREPAGALKVQADGGCGRRPPMPSAWA